MYRFLLIPAMMALTTPAFAQMNHDTMDHSTMDHGADHAHDHKMDGTVGHHDIPTDFMKILTDQPELAAAVAAGGEPIVADVLGAVCDFCAKAMNKTFGKRDDVAAVYVDLDTKTLNLVMKPGETMTDEALRKAVKTSGYKVDSIRRGAALTAS